MSNEKSLRRKREMSWTASGWRKRWRPKESEIWPKLPSKRSRDNANRRSKTRELLSSRKSAMRN